MEREKQEEEFNKSKSMDFDDEQNKGFDDENIMNFFKEQNIDNLPNIHHSQDDEPIYHFRDIMDKFFDADYM